MPIDLSVLQHLGFVRTHSLRIQGDRLVFDEDAQTEPHASVYLWLSPNSHAENFEVLYVGKAGFGPKKRMREHQQGFINSKTGQANRQLILERMSRGHPIYVYARRASVQNVLGEDISLYAAEEHALCERFAPLWNRAKFPATAERLSSTPKTHDTGKLESAQPNDAAASIEMSECEDMAVFQDVVQGEEVTAFFQSLPLAKRQQFLQLVQLLQSRQHDAFGAGQKVTRMYTGQPRNYDREPLYVFGVIGRDGKARQRSGWIPLVDTSDAPLTVIFPPAARCPGLDEALTETGKTGDWRPTNLSHFLAHAEQYLCSTGV